MKRRVAFLLYRGQTWQTITIIMAALLLIGSVGVSALHLSPRSRPMPTYQVAAPVPTDRATTLAYHLQYFGPTYSPSSTFHDNEALIAVALSLTPMSLTLFPTATAKPIHPATETATAFALVVAEHGLTTFVPITATETPEATATATPLAVDRASPSTTAPKLAQAVAVAEAPGYHWFVDAPIAASNPFSVGHNGVDVNVPIGTGVYAIASGYTYCAANTNGCGQININHGGGLISLYGHVDEQFVSCGQQVSGGQHIGNSGTLTCVAGGRTHPHAHLSIMRNNHLIDPMSLYYGTS